MVVDLLVDGDCVVDVIGLLEEVLILIEEVEVGPLVVNGDDAFVVDLMVVEDSLVVENFFVVEVEVAENCLKNYKFF